MKKPIGTLIVILSTRCGHRSDSNPREAAGNNSLLGHQVPFFTEARGLVARYDPITELSAEMH